MRPGIVLRWSAWSGVALIALGVALAWLAGSETALQWLSGRLVEASGGRLAIERLERFGFGGVRAARVRYADGALDVEANGVVVLLSPRSLLRASPVVRRLAVDELRVRAAASHGPARLPASLALPFEGRIESLEIARVALDRAQGEVSFGPVALALAYGAGRYRLDLHRLQVPGAGVAGTLRLAHAPPYAVAGEFMVEPRAQAWSRFALAFDGRLEAIGAGAVGEAYGAEVHAQALLTPFAEDRAAVLRARVASLDPRRIAPAAPRARLDLELQSSVDPAGRTSGRFRIDNRAPGSPARNGLPVVAVTGALHGAGGTWTVDELEVHAGRAGSLEGHAQWHDGEARLDLAARALDLKELHPRLHHTALSGPLRLRGTPERMEFTAQLVQPGLQAAIEGRLDRDRVTLRAARVEGRPGVLTARGAMDWQSPHRFEVAGEIRGLDPARIGEFPAARINAQLRADGALMPPGAAVALTIADSRYRGQAVTGAGRLRWTPDRVTGVDLALGIGAARLSAQGDFGASGDRLAWTLDVPDLQPILADTAGRLRAHGELRDRWLAPAIEMQADASDLRLGDRLRLDRLEARVVLAQGAAGRFDAAVQVQKLTTDALALDRVRLTVAGTRAGHGARLDAVAGKSSMEARLSGGLQEELVWSGTIDAFELRGPVTAGTTRTIPLTVGPRSAAAGPALVRWGRGQVDLAYLRWYEDGRLESRGRMEGIALSALAPVLGVPEALRTLVVGGEWSIDAGASLEGAVGLWRERGDVVIAGTPAVAADLRSLRFDARARAGEITFDARLESGALGVARAQGTTRAERRDSVWGIAGNAPIDVHASARLPTLAWARPLLGEGARLDGAADLELKVGGTWARPAYAGDLAVVGMRLAVPDPGFVFTNGDLRARFDGQRMEITSLRFAGGEGMLEGRGRVDLARGEVAARVDLTAHKLTVVSRPDRLLVVSGKGGVAWDKSALRAQAELITDRAVIELPREDVPRPSSDVIVLGRAPAGEREIGVQADVSLDLGTDFAVRGRGLDARLAGAVRAQIAPKARPTVTGTVRAVGGTYAAFGQTLSIERAALNFVGPPDNPALDVLAMRKNLAVDVGVAVGGTALLPQVRLVSNPAMSDADKLAWLTLGHGLSQTGGNEAAVLQAAALALMSRDDDASGFSGGLAGRLGLDELSLGAQSTTGQRVVTLGKRFASNVYVGFEHGVSGATSVVKITYDLSRRWSVQARAGTEHAVDLFYTLGFK